MFKSTRGNKLYTCSQAIVMGLAEDGGLFVPEKFNSLNITEDWLNYSYQEVAIKVLKVFFDEYSEAELNEVVSKAYNKENFSEKIVGYKHFENYSYLELFYGNTLAFKDMALAILPHLFELACKKINLKKKITILTATSGDTGGAVLSGFSKSKDIDVFVVYPNNGVSPFQEKQMLSFTNRKAKAVAFNGNFDDCQTMVKEIFLNKKENDEILLSSANSINIARLVPQVVYYVYSYLELVRCKKIEFNEFINVCVPTGNFGNILASYYAKKIGLPIKKFICASNENKILTDFFNSGIYDTNRDFYKTISPSMDILVSSNLERLIALLSDNSAYTIDCMSSLKNNKYYKVDADFLEKTNEFEAYYAKELEIKNCIKEVYKDRDYLIDPHTAVAKIAYEKSSKSNYTLIVSTASPFKFMDTILEALDMNNSGSIFEIASVLKLDIPSAFRKVLDSNKHKLVLNKEEIVDYLFAKKHYVNASASSANLSVGFDSLGIALNIYNVFSFYNTNQSKLFGFADRYCNLDDNLIYKAYCYVFNKINKEPYPICIFNEEENIPISRGLGSSSSCIVAGVLVAAYKLGIDNKNFLLDCMIELEGHPDNVAPAYLGGFVGSIKTSNGYKTIGYPVSEDIHFTICYPNFELETKMSRSVLPKSISISDFVYDSSRIFHLPLAFKNGDLDLLKELLNDKIHEPYRFPLIDDSDILLDFAKKHNYPICLSGSGPSILILSSKNIINELRSLNTKHNWKYLECNVNHKGSEVN